MVINNLNFNDKSQNDDNNIRETIDENDNSNKVNEFKLDKINFYKLPVKNRFIKNFLKKMKRKNLLKGKNVIL